MWQHKLPDQLNNSRMWQHKLSAVQTGKRVTILVIVVYLFFSWFSFVLLFYTFCNNSNNYDEWLCVYFFASECNWRLVLAKLWHCKVANCVNEMINWPRPLNSASFWHLFEFSRPPLFITLCLSALLIHTVPLQHLTPSLNRSLSPSLCLPSPLEC